MKNILAHLFDFGWKRMFSRQKQCSGGSPDKHCDRRRTKFYHFLSHQAARYRKHQARQGKMDRKNFRRRFGLYLEVIALAKGVIVTVVERVSGRPGQSDESISSRLLQSAAFIQGIGLCEQSIFEALYVQAGALVRQEMEVIASMEESKLGTRDENTTPNVRHVPKELRRAYGQLSMMTHTSSMAMLDALLSTTSNSLYFASVVPQYNHEAARMLIGLHAALLIEFAVQLHILYFDSYGEGLTPQEQDSLHLSTCLLQEDGFLPKPPHDAVHTVPNDDTQMCAAIDKARETLPSFFEELKKPSSGNSRLFVKARFSEGEVSEHIWLTDLTADGSNIHGTIANYPNLIKRPRFQQQVTVTHAQITDWMIEQDGQIQGAFTTAVLNTNER